MREMGFILKEIIKKGNKMNTKMSANGLSVTINMPEALKGENLHNLPPYAPQSAYVVDEYSGCPNNWMHGSNKSGSFFVPLQFGKGMWFDFTHNESHQYHVAVVTSVQGVNPIIGPMGRKEPASLDLWQIKNTCPEHDCELQQDRYCPQCGYKLPAQNYIATTTGQRLWIDGFRNTNGEVLQYIITEDITRGIAYQTIGDERIWAIGFAFYLSKEPKPYNPRSILRNCSFQFNSANVTMSSAVTTSSVESSKLVEIGAGSRIQQEIGVDPNPIEFWRSEPEALIYVNCVSQEEAQKYINFGKRADKQNGFLQDLKTGN
jgi:hypothetical protein